jgi:hypothetical protein
MTTIRYELEDARSFDFSKLDAFADRTSFQTAAWLSFVAATQNAEPVVASLRDGGETVGYFTGLVARKYGLKLLGSPLPRSTTYSMGFNLVSGCPRRQALEGLREFAFRTLGCVHLELCDRFATEEDARACGFDYSLIRGYEVDLRREESALLKGMSDTCRHSIRKAAKSGVTIEEAHDADFARDYYAQFKDVMAKQSLAPPYEIGRVIALIERLRQEELLMLRARDKEGRCIATGIFPAFHNHAVFWAGASWREHQHLRPNEALMWHAMRHWKARGVSVFDMGGGGEYKRKYGGREIPMPWIRSSRFGAVSSLRNVAKTLLHLKERSMGKFLYPTWKGAAPRHDEKIDLDLRRGAPAPLRVPAA